MRTNRERLRAEATLMMRVVAKYPRDSVNRELAYRLTLVNARRIRAGAHKVDKANA